MLKKFFSFFLVSGLLAAGAQAQVAVQGGLNANQLASILAGSNITVSNAVITGPAQGYGSFSAANNFPFTSGVVLTNGLLSQVPGPNNDPNTSSNMGGAGTAEMNALGGANSYDVVTLEFDFVVQSASIQFKYLFASEEYPEFAPPNQPSFNDVFAFYISGPGIIGQENIALIPGTSTPVSIDNVNAVTNSQYYVDNVGGQMIQFDGYTTELTATRGGLTPCQTYHLRMVLADIQTANRNSAVFLMENSFVQENVLGGETQTINSDGIALEGCVQGSFVFEFTDVENFDRVINFTIGGTAVNGVDYSFLDNSITIPAGETQGTVFIDAISDGLTEGAETITLTYNSGVCVGTETVTLIINDAQPINYSLSGTNLDCFGDNSGEIAISASGGFPGYTYQVTDPSGVTSSYTSTPITGLDAGLYTVTVTDTYGCKAEALVIGGQFNAGTTFLPDGSGVTYEAPLTISGFNSGQTITNVNQIQQVCLTMEHSYLGDLVLTVEAPNGQQVLLKSGMGGGSCDLGEPIASGPVDGQFSSSNTDPGVGYEYCFNANPVFSTMINESGNFTRNYTDAQGNSYFDNYLPAGSYAPEGNFTTLVGSPMNGVWKVLVTDQFGLDNGYIFNWYISLIGDLPDSTVLLTQPAEITVSGLATNATCGVSNGSINISALNGVGNLTYLWSNGATTEDLSNVGAGTYTVTVTDANGCSVQESFIVNNVSSLAITESIQAVSCTGGSNGAVQIVASGGTAPYTYSWSNGNNTTSVSGLTAGTYTISLTDAQGCVYSESYNIAEAAPIQIQTILQQNEQCNTDNGAVSVNASGGNGSYVFNWNNGLSGASIQNLTSGTYILNVQDGNGCTASQTYSISNDLSGCSNFCYLDVALDQLTNESCGQGNGSISVTLTNAYTPTTISWSNGANGTQLTNLSAGVYIVTVTDANNCTATDQFTIQNQTTNGLQVSGSTVVDEICGNSSGSIDIQVNGGIGNLTYLWSNNQTSQDLTGLSAGTYSVTVTDNSNCSVSQSFTVANNAGSLIATASVAPDVCGSSNGSINQTITGNSGNLTYLWSDGATTQDRFNLSAGIYSCVITDAQGCSLNESYTVASNSGSIALQGFLISNEVCNATNGSINITVSGNGLTYMWSNGSTTEDISGLNAGNYTCTITNNQGCSLTTPVYQVINTPGTLNVANQSVLPAQCALNNGSANVTVSGGSQPYTYSWSNGAGTEDISNLAPGNYTLQVSDNGGCVKSHTVTITSSPGTLAIGNAQITHESCVSGVAVTGQGGIDISVSGGASPYTYSWSNGATTQDISAVNAGIYTVQVSDNSGCSLNQSYTVLANGTDISISSVQVQQPHCADHNGAIQVTMAGTGPYAYAWSSGQITEDLTGLNAGTYTLQVTNPQGCQVSQTIQLNANAGSLALSGTVTDETCGGANGAIDVTVSGGNSPYVFNWSNGTAAEDLSSISSGTYSLEVVDIYGCEINYTGIVANIANGLSIQMNAITDEVCGQLNGAIDITTSGASTITWSNGPTSEDISGLTAGTYTVTIFDGSGCSTSAQYLVNNQTGSLQISQSNIQNETCGNNQGYIDIEVQGNGPFDYLWSTTAISQDLLSLGAGNYTVSITDALGCVLNSSFTVGNDNPNQVTLSSNVTDATCGLDNGAIDVTVLSGILPLSYSWSNSSQVEDIQNLAQGSYTLTITDGVNCISTFTYGVNTAPSTLGFTVSNIQNDFCGNGFGQFTVNATEPVVNYYLNGGLVFGGPTFFGMQGGQYDVSVENAAGCIVTNTVTVGNDVNFNITEVITDANCGASNGAIDLTVQAGPGSTVDYVWSTGAITQDVNGLSAGNYNVQLVVDGGFGGLCFDTRYYTIQDLPAPYFNPTVQQLNTSCAACTDGSITLIMPGGGYSFNWSTGGTSNTITGLAMGNYSVTITTPGGCDTTMNFSILNGLGIDEVTEIDVVMAPNPASEQTVLNWFSYTDRMEIAVLDASGSIVFETVVSGDQFTLVTEKFATGMYYVRLKNENLERVLKLAVTRN